MNNKGPTLNINRFFSEIAFKIQKIGCKCGSHNLSTQNYDDLISRNYTIVTKCGDCKSVFNRNYVVDYETNLEQYLVEYLRDYKEIMNGD